jgi:hypothetical protein
VAGAAEVSVAQESQSATNAYFGEGGRFIFF